MQSVLTEDANCQKSELSISRKPFHAVKILKIPFQNTLIWVHSPKGEEPGSHTGAVASLN